MKATTILEANKTRLFLQNDRLPLEIINVVFPLHQRFAPFSQDKQKTLVKATFHSNCDLAAIARVLNPQTQKPNMFV